MKITAEYLHRLWSDFGYFDGGYIMLDTEHPLECYLGYQDIDHKVIMFLCGEEPKKFPESKSILPTKGRRPDGKWTLSLKLLRNGQEDVFEIMCADILRYSSEAPDDICALRLIDQRYKQWHLLMQHQKKSLMDESSRKGLLGELLFLQKKILSGMPPYQAVEGWVGPDGADQDFSYADSWHEIKAVGIASDSIKISSLEQLSRIDAGEIVVARLDKCAPERNGAMSLTEAVRRTEQLLMDSPEAQLLYEAKLIRYGYIDLAEYQEQKYAFSGWERYAVDSNFPRLIAGQVPSQITAVQYTLSLAGINDWKQEE